MKFNRQEYTAILWALDEAESLAGQYPLTPPEAYQMRLEHLAQVKQARTAVKRFTPYRR